MNFFIKILWAFFFCLLFFGKTATAQYQLFSHFGSSVFTDAKIHTGFPIPYSDSLSSSLQNPFTAVEFRFGINSFDRMPQDIMLGQSIYGLGLTHYDFHSDTLGTAFAFFGFYSFPLIHGNIYNGGVELDAGLSFFSNHFDFVTNPKNDIIGSTFNVYFNLSAWSSVKVSERWDMIGSLDFTHFSNGTVKTPNKGLNAYGVSLAARYHFQFGPYKTKSFERKKQEQKTAPEFESYNEWQLWAGGGPKTTLPPRHKEKLYPGLTLSADFNHRYGWIGKYGIGADLFYDGSLAEDYPPGTKVNKSKMMFVGVHLNHEFVVGDFSLGTQIGIYLWKGMDAKGLYYIRASLRYDVAEHLFINLSLKTANGLKADYIELGMGYRMGNWVKK